MPADLHIHTTFSDGSDSPRQVVDRALAMGLEAIAVTDHDTVAGVPVAVEAAKGYPLVVIPGVEINTDYTGREMHILGYYINTTDPKLLDRLGSLARARNDRVDRIVKRLDALGVHIDLDEVRTRTAGTLGRPHIAEALRRAGVVSSIQEAFDRFIGRGGPAYVPRSWYTPGEAVAMVIKAGGVPVLAHPGTANADGLIPELIELGLKGLEVYHPEHDPDCIEHYLRLCQRYGLIATGGSDYHGQRCHFDLGESTVSRAVVDQLRALSL
ncbi:MAG: PHP domain-containing protein [Desulforudis sp.]|jgi:predicted metal-dependent phosphoesterase TrpH|nr:MAG: PHP domain-containing protein [Desulforudis sp.]